MKAWRALLVVCFATLSGCLVTFTDPIPANEAAPIPLLGLWQRQDEWGEQVYLQITRAGSNVYKARVYSGSADNLSTAHEYGFTVAHHGRRWYFSAGLPKRLGANFTIAGFELTAHNELVLFNLDVARIKHELDKGNLKGELIDNELGQMALVTSPLSQVLDYLNDQANSDVFIEVARYQRSGD
ncbi:hypothetical protein [Pseudomonas sp. 5P_3.1_Bac2]|uniref:hypothetical protein n=1 Tax=Pseudomonas sp. 5P_3.1_Bac2 TaxID=2971617 RepID=UPI0021C77ABE|nr:hypothetical protein [Pseudomonas sp. 5P_3.1_Bac2]MCU1719632.1 hypothetical protein [Pseudomonas sp. 5P_3.1_Bac2]